MNDNLHFEYQAAHDSFHHYDGFKWQSGTMLIASSTVLWGLLFSRDAPPSATQVACASIFISLLLSMWLLYAHHYRQLYMSKLHRIHLIELELKMKLNAPLGFIGVTDRTRNLYGPKGHNIDIFVCMLITIFGPIYQSISCKCEPKLFFGLFVMMGFSCYVHWNEKKMLADYKGTSTNL